MRFGTSAVHGRRAAAVVLLIGAMTPFGAGVSAASQGGDDHKVTICHRTNAENNPYVEVTLDKAAVFKRGHDTHDEGGVHQPGDKANGVRWGDIIPAFDYFASPQDETAGTVSHYAGLNNTAEGLDVLGAGCEVPDENPPEPSGSIDGDCLEDGSFVVSGVLDDDGGANVAFRLNLNDGTSIGLNGTTSFEEALTAEPGTTITLQAKVGDGDWTDVDGPVTVADCAQPPAPDTGKLKIKKEMEGDPIGTSTDFAVRVDCPGTQYDEDVALNAGNNWVNTTGEIPTGTTCQIVEVKIPTGWNPEGITLADGTFFPEMTPADVTVGSGTPTEVSAIVRNDRRTGRVSITKVVEGDATGLSFTVKLNCEGNDYDQTAVLNAANNWTVTYRGIPSGITCNVTEPTLPAGWTLKSISPDNLVIDSFATIPVTVTNTQTGVIAVTKQLQGAANGASTTFTFDVDCPGTAFDQTVVVNVTSGTSATATTSQIPTGLTCTVTERSTPGWSQTSVVPAGGVVAVGSTVTFTNQRLQGTLAITKAVSPVAGGGTVVSFGDTLTYTLTVNATGNITQPNVVVTDYVPGFDPARPASGKTTYVPGSAACIGAGTCTVAGPDATGLITWSLGDMAGGTSRQVTFQVTIDEIVGDPGETVAVDVLNAGAVRSNVTPTTPSNEVVTPLTKTFPVKIGKPGEQPGNQPSPLPKTGTTLPIGPTVGAAMVLLALGGWLTSIGWREGGLSTR